MVAENRELLLLRRGDDNFLHTGRCRGGRCPCVCVCVCHTSGLDESGSTTTNLTQTCTLCTGSKLQDNALRIAPTMSAPILILKPPEKAKPAATLLEEEQKDLEEELTVLEDEVLYDLTDLDTAIPQLQQRAADMVDSAASQGHWLGYIVQRPIAFHLSISENVHTLGTRCEHFQKSKGENQWKFFKIEKIKFWSQNQCKC